MDKMIAIIKMKINTIQYNNNKYKNIYENSTFYFYSTILLYCTFYNRDKNNEQNVLMQKKTKKTEY